MSIRRQALYRAVLTLLLYLVVSVTPSGFAHPLEGYEVSGILRRPNVTISYYWIDAVDITSMRKQLAAKGPSDLGGVARDAYVGWKVRWRWPPASSSNFEFSKTRCEYEITVTLPKWRPLGGLSNVTASSRAQWRAFTEALAAHEIGHIEMVENRFDEPCEAIRDGARAGTITTLAEAHAAAKQALEKLRKQDRRYDEITDHGRTQGARL